MTEIKKGQVWQHYKGALYDIREIANRDGKPDFPLTVVYSKVDHHEEIYTKTAEAFLKKFTLARDAYTFREQINTMVAVIEANVTKTKLNYNESLYGMIPRYRDQLILNAGRGCTPILERCVCITSGVTLVGYPLIGYIVATQFLDDDRNNLSGDNISVMLVITNTSHTEMMEFPLTSFRKAERSNTPDSKDCMSRGVSDGNGHEIFTHYLNIREAAIKVITKLAIDESNARVQDDMSACWLLAGIQAGVSYDHRNKLDMNDFLNKLKNTYTRIVLERVAHTT